MKFQIVMFSFIFISSDATRRNPGITGMPLSALHRNLCPANWSACNTHCRIRGQIAGYCSGTWSQTCACVKRTFSMTSDVIPAWG